MIWTREEYLAHMTFEASPREMFCELFGPLVGLDAEWRAQGASEDEISLRAFGWDGVKYAWAPADTGARTGIAPRVLEETATHVYSIDKMGRKMQMCKQSASLPLPMSYPVTCPEDWESIRRWYDFAPERIDLEQLKRLKALQKEGTLVVASMPGGFDEPRGLMGEENLCYAFYDEPEMIHDMLGHMADTCLKVFERVLDFVTIDVLSVHEDMAGKTGPLAGSKQVREFIAPYYRKVWEPLKAQGCRLFSQDSDGNMNRVIDDFLDAGVNCMYPAEPMAGMDILALLASAWPLRAVWTNLPCAAAWKTCAVNWRPKCRGNCWAAARCSRWITAFLTAFPLKITAHMCAWAGNCSGYRPRNLPITFAWHFENWRSKAARAAWKM